MTLLFSCILNAFQVSPSDRERIQNALEAYKSGRNGEARQALNDLAERYPSNFEVIETLGLIYAEQGEFERALPLLAAGCKANPSSAEAAANLGVAYLQLKRVKEAAATLSEAVKLDPHNLQTRTSYGRALMLAGHASEAAAEFAAASKEQPANADLLYDWALAEFDAGNARQASIILNRIPPGSRSAQAESLCGDAEEKQGNYDRALACFQSAAQLESSEANLNAVGQELLRHWSFNQAVKIYQYSVAKYPASERLRTGFGVALYANGEYANAARIFSQLLVSFPYQHAYAKFLGQSCAAMKSEPFDSCHVLLTYARQHPADADAARLAAATILEEHDTAQFQFARRLLESVIAKNPRSADAFYRLGVLDQEEQKWSDSVAVLKRADALHPKWSKTHFRLALAYSHLNRKQDAHQEGELQKQFRASEDIEMENQRKEVMTFLFERP